MIENNNSFDLEKEHGGEIFFDFSIPQENKIEFIEESVLFNNGNIIVFKIF